MTCENTTPTFFMLVYERDDVHNAKRLLYTKRLVNPSIITIKGNRIKSISPIQQSVETVVFVRSTAIDPQARHEEESDTVATYSKLLEEKS